MRISQEMRSQIDQAVKNTPDNKQANLSFEHVVHKHVLVLQHQELENLVQDITKQGDRLAKSKTFPDLVKFKNMIKGFLRKTVSSGLDLKKSHHYQFDGSHQQLAIVKKVDQHLVELTDMVMDSEQKAVDLLGAIGEIKGLLINLYR